MRSATWSTSSLENEAWLSPLAGNSINMDIMLHIHISWVPWALYGCNWWEKKNIYRGRVLRKMRSCLKQLPISVSHYFYRYAFVSQPFWLLWIKWRIENVNGAALLERISIRRHYQRCVDLCLPMCPLHAPHMQIGNWLCFWQLRFWSAASTKENCSSHLCRQTPGCQLVTLSLFRRLRRHGNKAYWPCWTAGRASNIKIRQTFFFFFSKIVMKWFLKLS